MFRQSKLLGKRKATTLVVRSTKRTRRPRRLRRSKRRYASRPYIKLMRQPVPDQILTKLNYSENITMTLQGAALGVLSPAYYRFQTSLYDPDSTGTGHQPLWHDQLAAMYSKYRVHGIKYRFVIKNTSESNMIISGCVRHTSLSSVDGDYRVLRERRGTQKFHLGSFISMPTVVRGYMAANKPWGLSKKEFMADEDFDANIGANPTKLTYLDIYAWTMSTSNVTLNVIADLTFYCSFDKRAQPSVS